MAPHSIEDAHFDGPQYTSTADRFLEVQQPSNGSVQHPHISSNGATAMPRCHLKPTSADEVLDLVCVGFGPASLSIAVALDDFIESHKLPRSDSGAPPKVLFLEKQARFAWHAGMLLPGAKMQISFMKDMATLRDPTSKYTFINYLHKNGRLVEFMNLSTFLPARVEYEDYLRWCAGHFDEVVKYNSEVASVSPMAVQGEGEQVSGFSVTSRDVKTGATSTVRARNVIFAMGGQASIPKSLPQNHPRIIHSSQYAHLVPKILPQRDAPYRVAVLGAGQSAAEIFSNIQTLYPNSRTSLVMRSEFLKPSDDSPFVNSIFNPSYVDSLFPRPIDRRHSTLADARATNYGVVRLELIEHLYEVMYDQHRELGPDERLWPHRIHGATDIVSAEPLATQQDGTEPVRLTIRPLGATSSASDEVLDADLIVAATGYQRDGHLRMMPGIEALLPEEDGAVEAGKDTTTVGSIVGSKLKAKYDARVGGRPVRVGRDYGVKFAPGKVAPGSGIWLQGCCEGTHGLSDTLLSILATRSGEIVNSIFCQPSA